MLSNAAVKAARARARGYKLADERSLYLFVAPTGTKSWRMKFRHQGREQLLTLGRFPEISLADARSRRDAARAQLRQGNNPIARAPTRVADDADSFEAAARRWHAHHAPRWTPVHAADVLASLERDLFPCLGKKVLAAIDPPTLLRVLRGVEARGTVETARRLRQRVSAIFALANSEGRDVGDPAAIVARALRRPAAAKHHPALLELDDVRALLAACEALAAAPSIKQASRFLALTAVRLAAVRGARWGEFEGVDWNIPGISDGAFWRVPAVRMKLAAARKLDPANAHLVPLSAAAVQILRIARAGAGDVAADALVFVGRDGGSAIGEAAIGALYTRAGFAGRHVPHGWRASFSTIMNEAYPEDRATIDAALAHVAKGKVEAAYNRATHLARRRFLFDRWGELLAGD